MSSSKLAYLSKYTTGGGDEDAKKEKKKKKKKKKKHKDESLLQVIHDDGYDELPPVHVQDDDPDEDPLVVVDSEEVNNHKQQQEWSVVEGRDSDNSSNNSGRKRRRRHDSDDDDSPAPRRRRHDSDDDDDSSSGGSSPPRRRKRHDSPSSSPPRRRHDSNSDSNSDHHDDDSPPRRRRRHDSDSDNGREKMSSGHTAGLQQSQDFRKAEERLQMEKKREAQLMVDRHGMGETVYRDKSGKAVQQQEQQPKQLDEKDSKLLNMGRQQRLQQERAQLELSQMQTESFARRVDHGGLEDMRKNEIRAEDPMAAYAYKKQQKKSSTKGNEEGGPAVPLKPRYKGPPPKPNRFGIQPGYRWDGVDRGNGFEDKVLARKYSVDRKKEQAYRLSTADM